jgi:hypothetical protein
MNGYLMQEQLFTAGEDCFVESFSPENNYGVVFEDDGETAYFYAVEKDPQGPGLKVLDALHIYEAGDADQPGMSEPAASAEDQSDPAPGTKTPPAKLPSKLQIVWSKDWMASALVIDGYCNALFDFKAHGGYSINEFPPPNEIWTQGDRKLTDELMKSLF